MGVEEEFLLVDPATARTAPAAPAVLRRVLREPPPGDGGAYQTELLTTQIEASTGVCTTLGQLRRQLTAGRRRLAGAARAEGLRLVSSGSPVLGHQGPCPVTEGDRYARIVALYGTALEDYQMCGCHVHIGVPDRDTAVAVVNRIRPWLPVLLSLSVNSPSDGTKDRGYASWRIVEQARFPSAGIPPRFASAAAHDAEVDRLVEAGAISDPAMTFWLARPSSRFPTVEFRVADAAATVDEAVLQAALARALVRTALAGPAEDRPVPLLDAQVGDTAIWTAARHGLAGPGVDPLTGARGPAVARVQALLDHVAGSLEETGDTAEVRRTLAAVCRWGTGAERQRAGWMLGGPRAVVDLLADQTDPAGGPGPRGTPGPPGSGLPEDDVPADMGEPT
ncbi:glutamate--cysteine ligase [Streptomyces sodiiphilus]|uniref:Putative glutamate--cysteine ligase 2 n=2 Tax=Streptomyces sodiiphilus TaxID=226217 RepID=A0ABN2PV63_9ACTN